MIYKYKAKMLETWLDAGLVKGYKCVNLWPRISKNSMDFYIVPLMVLEPT